MSTQQPQAPAPGQPQPVNLPPDKLILSLNKTNAKIQTNANNELLFTLRNPIKLEVGDSCSLYKSYLNIRGQNSNTISLYEDYDVTIRSGYFIPASLKVNASIGNDYYEYGSWQEYHQVPDRNFVELTGTTPSPGVEDIDVTKSKPGQNGYSFSTEGDYNNPFIGVSKKHIGGNAIYTPIKNEATFKIPAGQYDVNALALKITSQLNGQQLADDIDGNLIFNDESTNTGYNKIFNTGQQFTAQFPVTGGDESIPKNNGLDVTRNTFVNKPLTAFTYNISGTTPFIMFLDHQKVYSIMEDVKRYIEGDTTTKTASDILLVDSGVSEADRPYSFISDITKRDNLLIPKDISVEEVTSGILGASIPVQFKAVDFPRDGEPPVPVSTIDLIGSGMAWGYTPFNSPSQVAPFNNPYMLPITFATQDFFNKNPAWEFPAPAQYKQETYRTYGTRTFSVVYDNENRFSISNLSEPYRIPKIIPNGTAKVDTTPTAAIGNQASKFRNLSTNPGYPQEASSGNFGLSFDQNLVKKTKKYLDLVASQALHADTTPEYWVYQWALDMLPHDYFYTDDAEGKTEWAKSLWFRLGFLYDDLGNITNKFESYSSPFNQGEKIPMIGYMTHNSYGSALQIGMSGLGNMYSQANAGTAFLETFDEVGIFDQLPLPAEPTAFDFVNLDSYLVSLDAIPEPEYLHILSTSSLYNATTLPDLSGGKNYFLIETDLIPSNFIDEATNKRSIIGFIDREFSTNDTIFSSTAIDFNIKQPKLVNTVQVNVLNPDGTPPLDIILGDSSAFLIIIQRNSNAIFNYQAIEQALMVEESATQPQNSGTIA